MTAMLLMCDPTASACTSADALDHTDEAHDLDEYGPAPLEAEPAPLAYDEVSASARPADARKWDGGLHFSLGLAPMSTLHAQGFHPGVRWDIETGMAWRRGRMKISVGPDIHILQYYGRRKPGFGVDAMATLSLRHVYVRVGAGTATGIPARLDIDDVRPMMGGLVGGGFVGRIKDVEGRIGLDYDVRMDTTGRVAQTVLVAMRLSFGP
ncbi:hypothetical protein OEB96_11175 [Paraliomyxa miuraensis]|nr:hypothetical protein [Paraliomyxa miuraensis]